METVNAEESSVSVAFEEIPSERWSEEVYKPGIIDKEKTLHKKPAIKLLRLSFDKKRI